MKLATIRSYFAAAVALHAVPALAATPVSYPSPGCAGTLQACIDGLAPGGTIEIAPGTSADEDLEIAKSLTLRGAGPPLPVIGGGIVKRLVEVGDAGVGQPAVEVVIEDLAFEDVEIDVRLDEADGHAFTLRNCQITNQLPSSEVVDIFLTSDGTVTIDGNEIVASTGDAIEADKGGTDNDVSFHITRNVITSIPEEGNIALDLQARGTGTAYFEVSNNLIHDFGAASSDGDGIEISVLDGADATFDVLHNTIDGLRSQFSAGIDVDLRENSTLVLNVFNNLVTNGADEAVNIFGVQNPDLALLADFNGFFGNAAGAVDWSPYTGGASNLAFDPLYQDPGAGDFRLQALSMAIDAGTAFPPNGLPATDLAGNARLVGAAPDLGAYELPEPGAAAGAWTALAALLALRNRSRSEGRRR